MKYSVIIPIYNAEKTLNKCLDSIVSQMNNETELILINDGSTDTSGEICREYQQKNAQIRYFEQQNSGVSVARNVGIDNAAGDYIIFVDSDDYLRKDAFELIEKAMGENGYDLVISPLVFTDGITESKRNSKAFASNNPDKIYYKISELICNKKIDPPISRVYKRAIIDTYNIRFPVSCSISEDRAFNIAYCLHIQSLKITDYSFYYYAGVTNQQSLSRKVRSEEELKKHFSIAERMIESSIADSDLKDRYKEKIREAVNFVACSGVYSRAKRMFLRGEKPEDIIAGIKSDISEVNGKKYIYPQSMYCLLIILPVKLKMYHLIYMVASKLAGGR